MKLLLLIVVLCMDPQSFVTTKTQKINKKTFIVPQYNLEGFQKFFLPKLEFKGMHHVYFNPDDINQVYKEQNMDPNNLECNLKYDPNKDNNQFLEAVKEKKQQEKAKEEEQAKMEQKAEKAPEIKGRPRPILRQKGYTHFIHIPLADILQDTYDNVIQCVIDENDLDALVPLKTMHVTLMVLRLKSEEDLPRWKKVIQSLKLRKVKLVLRGVGIFPAKPNTNFTRVLFIKAGGLDDLIHDLVQRAITEGLVTEQELSHIKFDKKTDMYRCEQTHLTVLKTKGNDIIDASLYLKQMNKLTIPKANFQDVRMSVIGSFDGENYFDQIVAPVDK